MPLAILAGIPERLARSIRPNTIQPLIRTEWQLVVVASKVAGTRSVNITLLRSTLEKVLHESPNVLCFHVADNAQRAVLSTDFLPFFRFVWLDRTWLAQLPYEREVFFGNINRVLAIEEKWLESVRPTDVRSPLMLPEQSFSTEIGLKEMWDSASRAADKGHIDSTAITMDRFRRHHFGDTRRGYRTWIDMEDRVFDHRGPRHGKAPFPRCCKYSFVIPDGFHFDVTSMHGRDFNVRDWRGLVHSTNIGVNINTDPHGHVI